MSHLFESFDFLDRGWDVRVLESQSLRSIFVWLSLLSFVLGMVAGLTLYQAVRLHRFSWGDVFILAGGGTSLFRYSRLLYRRLER